MSTSNGSPSKKVGWFRSMEGKLNHQNKLAEEAYRLAENPKYELKVKVGKNKKAQEQFATLLSDAKEDIIKRKEQQRKAALAEAKKKNSEKTVDNKKNQE